MRTLHNAVMYVILAATIFFAYVNFTADPVYAEMMRVRTVEIIQPAARPLCELVQ